MRLTHGDTAARAVAVPVLPGLPTSVDATDVVVQMVRRAASPGFESWWRKAENVGFCANPIHLSSTDIFGRARRVEVKSIDLLLTNLRPGYAPSRPDRPGERTP